MLILVYFFCFCHEMYVETFLWRNPNIRFALHEKADLNIYITLIT